MRTKHFLFWIMVMWIIIILSATTFFASIFIFITSKNQIDLESNEILKEKILLPIKPILKQTIYPLSI